MRLDRRYLLARRDIDRRDLARIGHIDENPTAIGGKTEALGMRLERNVEHLAVARRVDRGKRAAAIADPDAIMRLVDADIVGVVAERDAAARREIRAAIKLHRAVAGIGDIERIGAREIADALRLFQPGHAVHNRPRREIDDTDTVVAELGDEKPPAREIDGKMIDPARYGTERDFCLEHQRRLGGRACRAHGEPHRDQQEKDSMSHPILKSWAVRDGGK